ncbi:hypothetical protein mvi_58660 [Methylobacterium indicum]|uniref:Uncharacterized protein n=1 Tax=Methylobacterium indicum TaxID=1775910 RepID=A0A8H8WZQ3_9HYPH|nr:hypothetical protein mvi_58660 [Methylobacterium indicum]
MDPGGAAAEAEIDAVERDRRSGGLVGHARRADLYAATGSVAAGGDEWDGPTQDKRPAGPIWAVQPWSAMMAAARHSHF